MRVDFVKALKPILENHPQTLFITGDLGFNAFEALVEQHGKRFLNAGVAEQNMVGIAAGMALSGFQPWIYSIAPFVTYRCLEQIRNDVCLHKLPVRLVGNGGGYTYGIMGSTHHALEDIAVLKALPNLTLYFPCSNDHVANAVVQMNQLPSPAYLRLAVSPYNTAFDAISENPVTLSRQYSVGKDVTVIGVGHGVQIALSALKKTPEAMKEVEVFGIAKFPFLPELDQKILESVQKTGKLIVIEEHYGPGGMAESIKMALPAIPVFHSMCAVYSENQKYGSMAFHLNQSGLTPENLCTWIHQIRTKTS